jgi:GT2 family glycosyltransferase
MNKKISLVVVTYNSSRTIGKLLTSIGENKQYISEIIVIENNSPDKNDTKKICDKYRNQLNVNFVLLKKNQGFGKSCNYGASLSNSSHILFLNPDTELLSDSIKIIMEHMADNNADIVGGLAMNYSGVPHGSVVRIPNMYIGLFEFSNLGKLFNIHSAHRQFYYEDIDVLKSKIDMRVDAVSGAYLLITKEAFKRLNGFDDHIFMYLEDVDLGKRAKDLGMTVIFCPHSHIMHVGGASSPNKYKIRHQAWFDSRKYYYKKHFGIITNLMIQPLYIVEEFLLKKIKHLGN